MIGGLYAKDAQTLSTEKRRGQLLVRFKQLGQYFEICFSNSRGRWFGNTAMVNYVVVSVEQERWLRPELNSEGNGEEEMIDSR